MASTVIQRMTDDLAARFEREALPHRAMLLRSARRLTSHAHDAEDLVQETMVRACASFHSFQHGTNARAWLHRIMMNVFISGYRKKQREPFVDPAPAEQLPQSVLRRFTVPSAEDDVLARLPAQEVIRALRELPAEFRQAVYLVDVQGLSYAEAAAAMGTPRGTVLSRVHRGRKGVRSRLLAMAA